MMTATEPNTDQLWGHFSRTRSPELKRQLAMQYVGVVKFVVSKFRSYSRQAVSVIDENDLTQLGMIGLLDAIERFDPTRGVKFETYAITRVRGTVQDELRKLDWVPRSIREKVRTIDKVTQKIACNDTLQGSAKKIAAELSMSVDEYLEMLYDTQTASPEVISHTDRGEDILDLVVTEDLDVADKVAEDQLKSLLISFVDNLPQQDRVVIALYYYEELTFKEIASVLRLSESRVFQKHQAILERIREQVGAFV